ncbi:hypothetical protein BV898_15770 [Hypsibius exemplaris]|uniref:DDE Tnp4 domain-containing protein n=1 Tax=Hypsibius exemplaris TaxID=2072580 RepID=A0A9X6NEL8_HYPEX|nr:hypothetical protein BV898_15770 [Hypsibius exemplaris]
MKYKSLLLAYANGLLTYEEFVLLRRRPPRVKHKYRARAFSLPATSAEHCKDLFRVEKADIMRIIRLLEMLEKPKLKGRLSISSVELTDDLQQPFLTRQRMYLYAAAIANETGRLSHGMKIFAFIDGTFKQTCRPKRNQRIVYSGKESCHGLKYQAITAPDGLILHLAGPFEGARHDAFTYLESQAESMLREKMEEVGGQFRLYGDPA